MEVEVTIALGSNLGNPERNLLIAIEHLERTLSAPVSCSSFWQSAAQDMADDAHVFLNAVVGSRTKLAPEQLLNLCQGIEVEMGRARDHSYHDSRLIDLDIITYGDAVINLQNLVIPHPRVCERRFVLLPLAQLKPGMIIPGQSQTLEALLELAPLMDIKLVPLQPQRVQVPPQVD